jgi:hypothetical protein
MFHAPPAPNQHTHHHYWWLATMMLVHRHYLQDSNNMLLIFITEWKQRQISSQPTSLSENLHANHVHDAASCYWMVTIQTQALQESSPPTTPLQNWLIPVLATE